MPHIESTARANPVKCDGIISVARGSVRIGWIDISKQRTVYNEDGMRRTGCPRVQFSLDIDRDGSVKDFLASCGPSWIETTLVRSYVHESFTAGPEIVLGYMASISNLYTL